MRRSLGFQKFLPVFDMANKDGVELTPEELNREVHYAPDKTGNWMVKVAP